MSGHSKWHRIRHKKAANDAKRSQLFGQLAGDIKIAARQGADPEKNAALREAIDRAKKHNLPQANIERILSRDSASEQQVVYEGFSGDGASLIVVAQTDNTNRTVSEIRNIFKAHGGNLGSQGAVSWKFTSTHKEGRLVYTVNEGQDMRLSEEARDRVAGLRAELEEHPDVIDVYSDTPV